MILILLKQINNSPKKHQIWDSGWPPRDDTGDAAMADGYVVGMYWDISSSKKAAGACNIRCFLQMNKPRSMKYIINSPILMVEPAIFMLRIHLT